MSRILPSLAQEEAANATFGRVSRERAGVGATEARAAVGAGTSAAGLQSAHVAVLRMADKTDKGPGATGPGNPNVQGNYRALVDEFRVAAPADASSEGGETDGTKPVMERIRVQQVLRALDETGRLTSTEPQGPPAMSGEVLDAEDPMQGGAEIIDITPREPGA